MESFRHEHKIIEQTMERFKNSYMKKYGNAIMRKKFQDTSKQNKLNVNSKQVVYMN